MGEKMLPKGAAVANQGWKERITADLGKAGVISGTFFVCTWEEKRGVHQPTAPEQVYPVLSPLKGCINYPDRQIAFYEE